MGKYQSMLDDLKSPMLMPTLDSDVLQSILTTHLLNPKNVKDEDLRVSVSNCVLSLKPLNDSITKINNIISSNVDFVKRKQTLGNFFGSKLMNSFKGSHLRVGNALLLLGGELSIVESATDIEPEPTR